MLGLCSTISPPTGELPLLDRIEKADVAQGAQRCTEVAGPDFDDRDLGPGNVQRIEDAHLVWRARYIDDLGHAGMKSLQRAARPFRIEGARQYVASCTPDRESSGESLLKRSFQKDSKMFKAVVKLALGRVRVSGRPILLDSIRPVVRAYRAWRLGSEGPKILARMQQIVAARPLDINIDEGPKILARMQQIVATRPLDINIETTNFCAASCVFCPNSKVKRQKSTMSMTLFEKICDEYAAMGGGAVSLSSMQSDLFSDKELLNRIQYLQRYKDIIYVYATTYLVGASKLDDRELEYFLRSFSYLQISLGGVDKDGYREMYGINGYDVARKQLLRIKKIVDDKKIKIRLSLHFRTAHPESIERSSLIKELGSTFSTVEIRNEFFSWGGLINQEDLPDGSKLVIADNSLARANCAVASASMSINVDGSVVGCGCVDWNSKHVVGNVQNTSLKQVWQSQNALEFRTAFSNNKRT